MPPELAESVALPTPVDESLPPDGTEPVPEATDAPVAPAATAGAPKAAAKAWDSIERVSALGSDGDDFAPPSVELLVLVSLDDGSASSVVEDLASNCCSRLNPEGLDVSAAGSLTEVLEAVVCEATVFEVALREGARPVGFAFALLLAALSDEACEGSSAEEWVSCDWLCCAAFGSPDDVFFGVEAEDESD